MKKLNMTPGQMAERIRALEQRLLLALMDLEQCRREAGERYPTRAQRLRDCGYDEEAVGSACKDQSARRGAYAAALYAERSKPRTGLTVKEVMEVVSAWDKDTLYWDYTAKAHRELRDRLSAKLNSHAHTKTGLTVDELAQQIRIVDGGNTLGAGALADALMPFLTAKLNTTEQ